MTPPRKAIVLAAGLGERMRPLTAAVPKPLLPFWGRPALARALDLLAAWGVRDVLVNLHHGADAVFGAAQRLAPAGLRLAFSFEPVLLGTGGALRRAQWFLDDGEPFWLFNADVAAALDPAPLRRAARAPGTVAALWMHPDRGPRTVEARDGRVVAFRAARPGAPGTFTFCGLHLVHPRILDYLPPAETCSSIIDAYERAMADGWRVAAVAPPDTAWADLGTPEDYLAAHRAFRAAARAGGPGGALYDPAFERRARRAAAAAGARVRGTAAFAPTARIGRGARLEDVVLLDGARVAPGAALRGAVVGPGATARDGMERLVIRADDALSPAERAAMAGLGWRTAAASAEALAPRGSARSFLRLAMPGRRALCVRYGPDRPENARYAGHARFLRGLGLPVPAPLADDPAARFTVFEDLGRRSLADAVRGAPPRAFERFYGRVLDAVADWHDRAGPAARAARLALEPAFGPAVFRYEHELFLQRFLRDRLGRPAAERARVGRELREIARRLSAAPPVLLHRDLQASNVLLVRGRPFFIDFQGMRLGPAAYDLASFLCDPYVVFPPGARERLRARYAARRRGADDADLFWPAAVQRLCQALGAFARLGGLPGGRPFLAHIPAGTARLREAIDRAGLPLPALTAALRAAGA